MEKITQQMVSDLYTTIELDNDETRIAYSQTYLHAKDNTIEKALYTIFSGVAYNSSLSYIFSYEVMNRVAYVVSEMDIIGSEMDISELVESNTPVYNYDVLKLYNEIDIMDEYISEYGHSDTVGSTARYAYYILIETLSREVISAIVEYNE